MGIPHLFRWITKKYPDTIGFDSNLNIDNLYFDLNGLIHPCCHPENKEQPNNENEMFENIKKYINLIISIVKPQKLIYVAIDGVAPMAKINQQRMRRFKASKEKTVIKGLKQKLNMPFTESWDSNAITPGSKFLYDLSQKLCKFFKEEFKIKIIFSDCNVPGEGEHKFISYIRNLKDNKLSHCIYGLDADLIMLSLLLGRKNIYLFREKQIQRKDLQKSEPEFEYLYLDLLKKYFLQSFTGYNEINIINDFVVLSFFMGNDFLPNIPHLKIKEGGFDKILDKYRLVLKSFNNRYIIENDKFNIEFLKMLFHELLDLENNYKSKNYKPNNIFHNKFDEEMFKINFIKDKFKDPIMFNKPHWKKRYYEYYFTTHFKNNNEIKEICNNYLKTIKWNYLYYTKGCPSWEWYYPYRQTPLISDLKNFIYSIKINNIMFEKSLPLKPLEQLLCVLPPQSNKLLPPNISKLMTSDDSPILDYYPIDFNSDYLGKTFLWECHPIIPFINIKRIKKEFKKINLDSEINKFNNLHSELNFN